ncbi:MAG: hypothetical protein ACXVHX_27630 [Solirubrobacteraceae bacterium]
MEGSFGEGLSWEPLEAKRACALHIGWGSAATVTKLAGRNSGRDGRRHGSARAGAKALHHTAAGLITRPRLTQSVEARLLASAGRKHGPQALGRTHRAAGPFGAGLRRGRLSGRGPGRQAGAAWCCTMLCRRVASAAPWTLPKPVHASHPAAAE